MFRYKFFQNIVLSGATFALFLFPLVSQAQSLDSIELSTSVGSEMFSYQLNPREYKEDLLRIKNTSSISLELIVYPADSTVTNEGGLVFKQSQQHMNEVGNWVRLYPVSPPSTTGEVLASVYDQPSGLKSITDWCRVVQMPIGTEYRTFREYLIHELQGLIPDSQFTYLEALSRWCNGVTDHEFVIEPYAEVEVPFVLNVPQSVDPGEHTGALVVENVISSTGSRERKHILISEIVPGEIIREVDITGFKVSHDMETQAYDIVMELQNTGTVNQNLTITFFVEDKLFNTKVFEKTKNVIAVREQTLQVSDQWPKPFFGFYNAYAIVSVLTSEGEQTITVPSTHIASIPWLYVSSIVGLLALSIVIGLFVKIRKKQHYKKIWRHYTFRPGDSLESLAQRRKVSLKHILKVNDLKNVIDIEVGDKILLPRLKSDTKISDVPKKRRSLDGAGLRSSDTGRKNETFGEKKTSQKLKTSFKKFIIFGSILLVGALIVHFNDNQSGLNDIGIETVEILDQEATTSEVVKPENPLKDPMPISSSTPDIIPSDVTLRVLNGSGLRGVASTLAQQLTNQGFKVNQTGNADHFGYLDVTVVHSTRKFSEKEFVAKKLTELGYNVKTQISEEGNLDVITVIVGR